MEWVETVGFVGMALVALSIMMSDIVKLRILNMCGAAVFIVYGLQIGSHPVIGLNTFVVIVNIFYLFRIHRKRSKANGG